MRGAIHPLPQYAFMMWCLVKVEGQLYLHITHSFVLSHITCLLIALSLFENVTGFVMALHDYQLMLLVFTK
jgi:hypothetical protein